VENLERLYRPFLSRGLPDLLERLQQIGGRLDEIQKSGGRSPSAALRSERHQLAKEALAVQRRLVREPEYVADLMRQIDALGTDLVNARKAGYGAKAQQLAEQFSDIAARLELVPEKLRMQIYHELVARGEIMKSETGALPQGRTLGELTRWLRAQKLDSPKLSLRERFNLARALAERWDAGRDALTRAADKVSAAWEAFRQQYQRPPSDDDFRSVVKDWLYEKQWTGLETHRWLEQIRARIPNALRRAAISVWLDAGGNLDLLRSQAELVPARFKRIWQAALDLKSKEQMLARRVQTDFEQKLDDALNLGLVERGRADYGVPYVWDVKPKVEGEYDPASKQIKPQTPRNPQAKLDPRAPFFALHRTVPSLFDGIMGGGVPKLDIADLVGYYNWDFHNSLADRGVIKALKDAKDKEGNPIVMISGGVRVEPGSVPGMRTYFVDSNRRPKEAVTKDGRPYRSIDHWALRDWQFRSQDAEGNPIILRGNFLVHPDYFRFLKNELGQSWLRDPEGGGKYFNWLLQSAAFLKASKFASATFHMATIGEHALFHAVSPLTRGVELQPERNPKLAALMRNGLDLGFGRSRELFEEGLASHGGIWGHAPGLGEAMSKLSDYLFQDYIPKIKVKVGLAVLERNLARYQGKLSFEQISELSAQQANAAFGIQNWRLLGTNKTMLDINRLLLTAPDFLLSRAKVVGQALKPYNREQRYFLLAQAAVVYGISRVLNLLLDDDPHFEPENALSVVYKGRAYSARFLVNDLYHLVQEPVSFASGRFGPGPRALIESVTQRDMRTGVRIDVPFQTHSAVWRSAQILVKGLAQWLVPVGAEGLLPGASGREQTGPGQLGLALLGVGSRKYTAQTQMWQLAADYNRASNDPGARHFQERREAEAHAESAYRKLDNLLDADELDRARREYEALVAEGYKPDNIAGHYAHAQYFTGSAARERAFVQSLSAGQREIYSRAQAERAARLEKFRQVLRVAAPLRE
jgi:hypothetical protein